MKSSLITLLLLSAATVAHADEVRLLNGRTISGIISEEGADRITLEVGIGTMKLLRSEIASIQRSDPQEKEAIRMDWVEKRLQDDVRSPGAIVRTRSPWGKK